LIIDDSRDPLYAIPYADAVRAIFAGDRLGLVLTQQDAGLSVEFDVPNNPAQAARFNLGDKIALVDGEPAREWPERRLADLRYGALVLCTGTAQSKPTWCSP
jgi:hypothetical protein